MSQPIRYVEQCDECGLQITEGSKHEHANGEWLTWECTQNRNIYRAISRLSVRVTELELREVSDK